MLALLQKVPSTTAAQETLRAAVALETLEELLRWAGAQQPPLQVQNAIAQDEFSLDVLVPLPEGQTLVFETS